MKHKRAIIIINLVKESTEKTNQEIEREILHELSGDIPTIPWLESVKKVTVIEE